VAIPENTREIAWEVEMPEGTIDHAVFSELRESLGADFIVELVDTFLEEAPGLIAQLRPALDAGDVEKFRRAAHSLKTNAATFGAMPLHALAKELEFMARENRLGEVGDRIQRLEDLFAHAAAELKGLLA
jgi:HPt (histidine-containing phosphotransfer) domain-containing protein